MRRLFEPRTALCIDPGICTPFDTSRNIYFRTCEQLEKYLIDNGFQVSSVSRNSIGTKSFYHVESNVPESEYSYTKTNHIAMRKLLGINGIGIISFRKHEGMVHQVVLIDEDELNDKYLKNGNLVFQNGDCTDLQLNTIIDMIENVDTNDLSVLMQLSDIIAYIKKINKEEGLVK